MRERERERERERDRKRQTDRQTDREEEKIFEYLIIDISHCKNNNYRFHVKFNTCPNFIKYTVYKINTTFVTGTRHHVR